MSYHFSKDQASGAFFPAANSNKSPFCFTEEEELHLHHTVQKYGAAIEKSQIGDLYRMDVFLSAEEKAFGTPAMSVIKRKLREGEDLPIFNLFIGKANIESVCFLQTTTTLDKFIRENRMAVPQIVSSYDLTLDKM